VTVRRAEDPEDLLGIFYGLHVRNRRRLGVPVQPRRFFRMLWENLIETGLGLLLIAEAAGRPVAAAVVLAWNGTMIGKFIASDEQAWSLRPNNLPVWRAVQVASERGCRWFDFGRTDAANSGLRAYKQSWGAVEEPLVYGTLGAKPEPESHGNGMASPVAGLRHPLRPAPGVPRLRRDAVPLRRLTLRDPGRRPDPPHGPVHPPAPSAIFSRTGRGVPRGLTKPQPTAPIPKLIVRVQKGRYVLAVQTKLKMSSSPGRTA
jgi:hypothetical protein